MTRFLYVGNHAGYFLTHRLPVMNALKQAGYDVHVAVPDHADRLEEMITADAVNSIKDLGFEFHPIAVSRGSVNIFNELRSIRDMYQLYRRLQPDLIYHATIKPVIYGGLAARLTGMPRTINAMTGLGYAFSNTDVKARIIKKTFSLIYRFIMAPPQTFALFQNDDDRSAFVQAELVPAEQTEVIHGSGIDLNMFHPPVASPPLPVTIVLASRMLWDKGVGEFVEAAKACHAQGLQARFILVGDSDPDNPAAIPRQQLQAWHESGKIEWWGWRNDMESILQGAHIFCLPSYREGVSKAMLEALATGLPIVTTDGPGCRDLVHDQANGFLVPVQDTTRLTDVLATLITQPELRQQMGTASREIARQHYSVEIIVDATRQLCQRLLTQ